VELAATEFRRRCASMLKHEEELKRQEERRSFRGDQSALFGLLPTFRSPRPLERPKSLTLLTESLQRGERAIIAMEPTLWQMRIGSLGGRATIT